MGQLTDPQGRWSKSEVVSALISYARLLPFQELLKLRYLAINYRSFCTIVDKYMERLLRKGQIQSEHLPLVVFEMPALSVLDLEETKINCLPRTCVSKLRELYLAKNYLQVNSIMTYGTCFPHL